MPNYTLELELFGVYVTDMPGFQIFTDGTQEGPTYNISSAGTTISIVVNYGGALPSSLEFRFDDASGEAGRTIEVRSVKINDKHVNTGNYLSSDSLVNGGNATVNIPNADFIFDPSEPTAGDFAPATRTFTGANEVFRDLSGSTDETFDMLGGADRAYLGSGNDTINGGAGDDLLRGGAGNDLLYGADDNDRLFGEDGNDALFGGNGNDRIHGGAGDDEIHGGAGDDRLNGHIGDDLITGGAGDDKLNGGDGNDIIYGGDDSDQLTGGAGDDTLDGGNADDLVYGGGGVDHVNGGDGNDVLAGNLGADIIHGDDGNDTIYIMTNDFEAGEEIYGGSGTDELILSHASVVDFTTGIIDGLETLTGSDGDQDITYTIQQALAFTTIDLAGGTDTSRVNINGNVDATVLGTPTVTNVENGFLTGTAGNDTLTITGAQLDSLVFGGGTIDFSGGTDVINLTSTSANLNTLGATDGSINGLEEVDASGAAAAVTIDLNAQLEDFTIVGSSFNDTLTAGAGNDVVNAGAGVDTIDTGAGDNYVLGGAGDDNITAQGGNDTIYGGADDDTIVGGAGDDIIFGDGSFIDTSGLIVYDAFQDGQNPGTATQIGNGVNFSGNAWQRILVNYNITANTILEFDLRVTTQNEIHAIGFDNDTTQGNSTSQQFQIYGTQNYGEQAFRTYTGSGDFEHFTIDVGSYYTGAFTHLTLISDDDNAPIDGDADWVNIVLYESDGTGVTGDGNDVLTGGTGADTIIGGGGNDLFNLANGDFAAGESITGGSDTDEIQLTEATTVDFTTGTINTVEILDGSGGDDDVTYTIQQALSFSNINLRGGTDNSRVQFNGTLDVTGLGTPTVNNVENGFMRGSVGDDDLTISGAQVNALIVGGGTIDFDGGTDVLNLTSTSGDLNTLGNTDADIIGLETITAIPAAAGVTISLTNQTEDFTVTGSSFNDTLNTGTGNETINGGDGNDTINARDGDDIIDGGIGNDTINAGNGNDFIIDSGGDDTYNGNGDIDTLSYLSAAGGVTVSLRVTAAQNTINAGTDTITGIENLIGSNFNDTLQTKNGVNVIEGRDGDDIIVVDGTDSYDDTFDGGNGYDIIRNFHVAAPLNGAESIYFDNETTFISIEEIDAQNQQIRLGNATTIDFTPFLLTDVVDIFASNLADNVTGSTGDDSILGRNGDDILNGGAGNDTIDGGGNNDTINGGADNDSLNGGDGDDTVNGGTGNDNLRGGNGVDILNGDDGDDIFELSGGEGRDDTFNGGTGTDIIRNVSAGAINFNSGSAFNSIEEIDGNNQRIQLDNPTTIDFSGIAVSTNVTEIRGSGGDDTVTGTQDDDIINGGNGNDIINGDDGNDTINGQNNDDIINGGNGNDNLRGGGGIDILNGDAGNDVFEVNGNEGRDDTFNGGVDNDVIRNIGGGAMTFNSGTSFNSIEEIDGNNQRIQLDNPTTIDFSSIATSTNVTEIRGSNGADTIIGTQDDDFIDGRNDNDIINGDEGNDILWSGNGDDTLNGGNGNDTLRGNGTGANILNGDAGNDIFDVRAAEGRDNTFNGGADNDVVRNTTINNITFNSGTMFIGIEEIDGNNQRINIDANSVIDFSSIATSTNVTEIRGNNGGAETITGTQDDDIINGRNGNDILNGDEGNDTINGGGNDDVLSGGAGNDILDGDGGNDTASYITAAAAVTASLATNSATDDGDSGADTFVDIENLIGSAFNDDLTGDNNANILQGRAGDDILNGGAGDDVIYGDDTTVATETSVQGWNYQYYDLPFTTSSNLSTAGFTLNSQRDHNLASTTAGTASDFNPAIYDAGDDYALKFESTLTITTAGTYTFRTSSDDGSMLFLDGVQIVNNDGLHGVVTITSAGQALAVGTYTLELTFFERGGGNVLNAEINGPDTGSVWTGLANYAGANVVTKSGPGADGNDSIAGGAGTDILYGGGGEDTFIFEAASAFLETDTIMDFSTTDGDNLDISDILTGVFSGDIKDYLQFTSDGATGDTLVQVDANGTAGGTTYQTIARLDGIVGLDEVTLFNAGDIII